MAGLAAISALAAPGAAASDGAEVPAERTEFSETRRLPDGTFETRVSSQPVNFRDRTGTWRRIDNGLTRTADGTVENGASSVDVEIPSDASGEVSYASGGRSLSFSLRGADDGAAVRATQSRARFADAIDGVDVTYEVVGKSLKETLTLSSAAAPADYVFDVDAGDLTARVAPSGDVVFEDAAGRQRFGFAAPWVQDATGAVSRAVRYEVRGSGGSQRVLLRVDREWLADDDRRFPVIVDPTVYSWSTESCEISSGTGSNVSKCGYNPEVWVGRSGTRVFRGLVELDDLVDAVGDDDALVLDSWFAAYLVGQSRTEASEVDLHHLVTEFASGATWNRSNGRTLWARPGGDYRAAREARRDTVDPPPDGWVGFDVTELAQGLVDGSLESPNVLLKAADESRDHYDVFEDFEVRVRWAPRTGIDARYTYDHRTLSDGSTLDVNVGNGNVTLLSNDIDLEIDDGRFTVGRYANTMNRSESAGTFGRGSRGDFGSIALEYNRRDGGYVFLGPGAVDGAFSKREDGGFTPPAGLDANLTENPDGTLTLALNDSTETWTFDDEEPVHRLVQTRQDYGYQIDGTYGPDGLATLSDSAGNTAAFAYDGNGDMRTITDDQSSVHSYDYDGSHRLTTYTAPTGPQTRYAYDGRGRLSRISLPDRTALRLVYLGDTEVIDALVPVDALGVDQPATTFDVDAEHTIVQPPGAPQTVYFFDSSSLVVDLVQHGSAAAISATGAIPDLAGAYTRGDAPLSVQVAAAQAPDGIQLVELEVEGVEVDAAGDGCDETTCPRRRTETLAYDPTFDPEGTYEYRVNAVDGDDERTLSPLWRIVVDRTAPTTSATSVDALFDADGSQLLVEWEAGADPQLADGTPGRIARYEYRTQRDGQGWSAWQGTVSSGFDLADASIGEAVDVEIRAVDAAGNVGPVAARSFVIAAPPPSDKLSYVIPDDGEPVARTWNPPLQTGQTLRLGSGGDTVLLEDAATRTVSTLATAFARDAENRAVPVSYAVSGGTVTITVAHRASTVAHPVLVDTRAERWDTLQALAALRGLNATLPQDEGFSPLTVTVAGGISKEERDFCRDSANTIPCPYFYMDSRKATALTKYLFGADRGAGRGNAFRHAFWTAMMVGTASAYGTQYVSRAIELATAHEGRLFDSRDPEIRLASLMDVHNNGVGYEEFWMHPEVNDEVVCNVIRNKIKRAAYQPARSKWRTGTPVYIERAWSRFVSGRGCGPA